MTISHSVKLLFFFFFFHIGVYLIGIERNLLDLGDNLLLEIVSTGLHCESWLTWIFQIPVDSDLIQLMCTFAIFLIICFVYFTILQALRTCDITHPVTSGELKGSWAIRDCKSVGHFRMGTFCQTGSDYPQ